MADTTTWTVFHNFLADLIIQMLAAFAGYKSCLALKRSDGAAMKTWLQFWICYGAYQLVEVVLHQILFNMSFYPELRIGVVAFLIHSEGPAKIYPHLETAIEKAGAFIEKKLAEVMKKKE
eukprot:CAMPEP_0170173966 /NCGR_PEP_ID=MMETSP0040_2-20121228/7224_1 /TAXON_ID=641309 /ORGANISM="Lotharella oceanica, Strain CCMP622" /LENGTH=119 /DNA_ID=CAMNT_0010415399 /DNA_START=59 /DNA_END=418 /DNA_ORIENTATION=-